jgi:hypothetical protein
MKAPPLLLSNQRTLNRAAHFQLGSYDTDSASTFETVDMADFRGIWRIFVSGNALSHNT